MWAYDLNTEWRTELLNEWINQGVNGWVDNEAEADSLGQEQKKSTEDTKPAHHQ